MDQIDSQKGRYRRKHSQIWRSVVGRRTTPSNIKRRSRNGAEKQSQTCSRKSMKWNKVVVRFDQLPLFSDLFPFEQTVRVCRWAVDSAIWSSIAGKKCYSVGHLKFSSTKFNITGRTRVWRIVHQAVIVRKGDDRFETSKITHFFSSIYRYHFIAFPI